MEWIRLESRALTETFRNVTKTSVPQPLTQIRCKTHEIWALLISGFNCSLSFICEAWETLQNKWVSEAKSDRIMSLAQRSKKRRASWRFWDLYSERLLREVLLSRGGWKNVTGLTFLRPLLREKTPREACREWRRGAFRIRICRSSFSEFLLDSSSEK